MVTDHPFQPPHDAEAPEPGSVRGLVSVLLTWALCGACVGTSAGATLQLTGQAPGAAGALGVFGIFALGAAGGIALRFERHAASSRPEVLDARGHRGRPLHGGLYLAPILLTLPALLWLIVVGSVAAQSRWPAFGFGMASLVMAWSGAKVWANWRMTRALEWLELGRTAEAREQLGLLQGSLFASRGARDAARLGLGGLELQGGHLDAAAGWYEQVRKGQAGAFASAGLAMVHVLRGRLDAAEEEVQSAMASPSARLVQGQVDTVRLLLVWRRHGPAEARLVGERLLAGDSGAMFRALLGQLRRAHGDEAGAVALLGEAGQLPGALVAHVPELAGAA